MAKTKNQSKKPGKDHYESGKTLACLIIVLTVLVAGLTGGLIYAITQMKTAFGIIISTMLEIERKLLFILSFVRLWIRNILHIGDVWVSLSRYNLRSKRNFIV